MFPKEHHSVWVTVEKDRSLPQVEFQSGWAAFCIHYVSSVWEAERRGRAGDASVYFSAEIQIQKEGDTFAAKRMCLREMVLHIPGTL